MQYHAPIMFLYNQIINTYPVNTQKNEDETQFIEQWLTHFKLEFEKDLFGSSNNYKLDYLIPETGLGILISNWKKPISVLVVNQGLDFIKEFGLNELIIISNEISQHALEVIGRFAYPIRFLHRTELSDIAIKLVELSKSNPIPA